MRHVTAILSVAAVVLMAADLFAQAKPSFAGEWKAVVSNGRGEPGVDLIITQNATAMTVEYRRGGPAPAPVKLTYQLDGSVSKNVMAGNLVVETSAPARSGGVTKVTYKRYERGHGG